MSLIVSLVIVGFLHMVAGEICPAKYEKVGCYDRNKDIFNKMLVNHRDGAGTELDWKDFQASMKRLSCECAKVAKENKIMYFAITFYGECYGAPNKEKFKEYSDRELALSCIHNYAEKCDRTEGDDKMCAGTINEEYVYSVVNEVNGGYTNWSNYGACSKTCGGGVQERSRSCTNPKPMNGGKECSGLSIESRKCNTKPCPIDGGYTNWANYGSCSKTCGGGVQERRRSCTNPKPMNGGKQCSGLSVESRQCNTKACLRPQHCELRFTPYNLDGNGNVFYLDRHNVNCKPQEMLNLLKLERSADLKKYRYRYKCCNIRVPSKSQKKENNYSIVKRGNTVYLDRQNIQCPGNAVLSQVGLRRKKNKVRYTYTCSSIPRKMECKKLKTQLNIDGKGDSRYLDRHMIKCTSDNYGLNQLRLLRGKDWKTYAYHYRCCKPIY